MTPQERLDAIRAAKAKRRRQRAELDAARQAAMPRRHRQRLANLVRSARPIEPTPEPRPIEPETVRTAARPMQRPAEARPMQPANPDSRGAGRASHESEQQQSTHETRTP